MSPNRTLPSHASLLRLTYTSSTTFLFREIADYFKLTTYIILILSMLIRPDDGSPFPKYLCAGEGPQRIYSAKRYWVFAPHLARFRAH